MLMMMIIAKRKVRRTLYVDHSFGRHQTTEFDSNSADVSNPE